MSKTLELTNHEIIVLLAAIFDAKERMREKELSQMQSAYINNLTALAQRLQKLAKQQALDEVKGRNRQ